MHHRNLPMVYRRLIRHCSDALQRRVVKVNLHYTQWNYSYCFIFIYNFILFSIERKASVMSGNRRHSSITSASGINGKNIFLLVKSVPFGSPIEPTYQPSGALSLVIQLLIIFHKLSLHVFCKKDKRRSTITVFNKT